MRGALRGATWRGMGGGKPVVPRVFLSKPGRNSTRFVTIHIEALVIYIYITVYYRYKQDIKGNLLKSAPPLSGSANQ